jgi:hypothetical protein
MPQMPNLSSWIAPTLSVEELEKRIRDLKAVHFWLDQNAKALGATIQALEVQKMTLATLQGMNFNMNQVAEALKLKMPLPAGALAPAAKTSPTPPQKKADEKAHENATAAKAAAGVIDPLQWWGALTQQFQQIATNAMKDVADQTAASASAARAATAKKAPKPATRKTTAPKRSAKKAAH